MYNIYRNNQNTPFELVFQSGSVYETKYNNMMGLTLRSNRQIESQNEVGFYDIYGSDIGLKYAGYYAEYFNSVSNVQIPNGCIRVKVLIIGAGGGGGNGDAYSNYYESSTGGSGGSGSFCYFEYTPITYKYSVVTGLGGKAIGNSSGNGQLTSFIDEGDISLGIGSRTNYLNGGGVGGTPSINNNLGGYAGTMGITFGENVGNYDGYTGNSGAYYFETIVNGGAPRQSAYVVQLFNIGTFYPSSLPLSGISGQGGNNNSGIGSAGQNGYCRVYYVY